MKQYTLIFLALFYIKVGLAQEVINEELIRADTILLNHPLVQMNATDAVNDMYNFKFERAANRFRWFEDKYPEHPLPPFLLALNEWWQMMPNLDNKSHDEQFLAYLDQSIDKAKGLYKRNKENYEASFFLAAAYAFKGRLEGERKNWRKATFSIKSTLKHLKIGRKTREQSAEFLFGEGLYNYYRVWLSEEYALLKPVLMFFRKGNKDLGIRQLEEATAKAFYTKTEAQYFLMQIYKRGKDKASKAKAFRIAEYLHKIYPDNAYFHRYYMTLAYVLGKKNEANQAAEVFIEKKENNFEGYEAKGTKYAAFILGKDYRYRQKNDMKAKEYFKLAVKSAEVNEDFGSYYCYGAWSELASIEEKEKQYSKAIVYHRKVIEHIGKSSSYRRTSYTALGRLYFKVGNYKLSRKYHLKTFKIAKKWVRDYKKKHNKTIYPSFYYNTLLALGKTHDKLGNEGISKKYFRKVLKLAHEKSNYYRQAQAYLK